MKYKVTSDGFYGKYGGAFVPEMLYPNVEELSLNYLKRAFPNFLLLFLIHQNLHGKQSPLVLVRQ